MIEKSSINEWISALGSVDATAKNIKLIRRIKKFASKPRRQRVVVNLKKLSNVAKDGDNIIVPGKVLAVGKVSSKFNIAAIEYSKDAIEKLKGSGCNIVGIREMLGKKDIRLII